MKAINLLDSDDAIKDQIKHVSQIKFDLIDLNTQGKKKIRLVIEEILIEFDKAEYAEGLCSTILELAFNAVKANYAYLLVLAKMKDIFPNKIDEMIKNGDVYKERVISKTYDGLINSSKVKDQVKGIIREQKKVFDIHEKAKIESRRLTNEEETFIDGCIINKLSGINSKLRITMNIVKLGASKIIFDIFNDAPLSQHGLDRIKEKRANFREYYKEDRVAEFYMENLDETESAGFGSAMIDSQLLEWEQNPEQAFSVNTVNNKTCATIKLSFKSP